MSRKCVLVVNSDSRQNELIQEIFLRLDPHIVISFARTGREALYMLMGNDRENNSGSRFLRFNVLLVHANLPDMPAVEFLGIIRKYVSLSYIRHYLLTDQLSDADHVVYDKLVSGYVMSPGTDDASTVEQFRSVVNGTLKYDRCAFLGVLPLSGFLKSQMAFFKSGLGLTKSLACMTGLALITCSGLAFVYFDNDEKPVPKQDFIKLSSTHVQRDSLDSPPVDSMDIEYQTSIPAPVKNPEVITCKTDTIELAAIPEVFMDTLVDDTVFYEKKFSIGVRGTR